MPPPTRRRTRAREIAMQLLFQVDVRGPDYLSERLQETERSLEGLCAQECQGESDIAQFAARLVAGTLELREEIDQRLQSVARNWNLRRMATVDRNVLRMAVYELCCCSDVPPKVAINEAIDLAKKYSTANSGGFVNGILDRVRLDLIRERRSDAERGMEAQDAPR